MSRVASPLALSVVMCLAEIAGMAGFATFAGQLPVFMDAWSISNTEAGWINGIYFAGYMLAVPVLVSLTDRVPPKRIYILSMALSGLASLGFAFLAEGFWTALLFRTLAGIGLAGTYMPGLKLLSDYVEGPLQSRAVAFYTASFSIGAALSFFMTGEIAALFDWRMAFAIAAAGPLLALVLTAPLLPREHPENHQKPDTHLLDFRPVLKCRQAMGYVLAYAAHNYELFTLRTWVVAYVVFAAALRPSVESFYSATVLATAVTLMGVPASILGNEFSARFNRNKVITRVMLASGALAVIIGFTGGNVPMWLLGLLFLFYGVTVTADSASLTAGVIAAAPKGYRGATMAVHASIGFSGAFLGPLVFGVVLDVAGAPASGGESVLPWAAAFAITGAVVALGPAALKWAAKTNGADS
ncbi:MAG: MFS transporter [Rhodospirillaceae bacterium]|nr:MFS transporter [Rhodospirillaceae bacterium]